MAIRVINIIPQFLSGETNFDSEPSITANPSNPQQIVISSFTPDTAATVTTGPYFFSNDGGTTWAQNSVIPGGTSFFGTKDISIRFGGSSGVLYAGVLRGDSSLRMNILRKANFSGPGLMAVLVDRTQEDQPWVEAATHSGTDRVYVSSNDISQRPTGQTASVDFSLDAATAAAPAGFTTTARLETRTSAALPSPPGGRQDGPSIRVAIHSSGVVYGGYFGWRTFGSPNVTDIVVVRDDNWASGGTRFGALTDPTDTLAGRLVATSVQIAPLGTTLGTQRIGSSLSIAVDPRDSQRVYVAWCDGLATTASPYTLRVRRSDDGGQNWSGDLFTAPNATNPGLAVNAGGTVAVLYQESVTVSGTNRWRTHLVRSRDAFTTVASDAILADVLDSSAGSTITVIIGDYDNLIAVGNDFYGVFSAHNVPAAANFPSGVTYLRNANFATQQLLAVDNVTPVLGTSVDPFFLRCVEDALQVVASTDVGGVWHTIRHDDQSWQTFFGDVKSVESNDPGHFSAVGCAGVRDDLHLVGLTDDGRMWHTIRHDDQSWQPFFGDVKGVESNDPGYFRAVACAGVNDDLHVVALTDTGGMWHTIRHRDGSWQPSFGDVKSVESNDPGHFSAVGCAGVSGELHVAALTDDGRMWHTIRHDDQSWQPFFGDVKGVESNDPGYFSAVAAGSGVNGDLHLVATTDTGGMWHTIRHRDGSWQPSFGDVKSVESNDPGHFSAVGCAGVNGEVHVVGLTDDGRMWHTIRHNDQSWQPFFGDVKGVESNDPGYFATVACAGVERAADRVVSDQVTVPDVVELKSGPAVNMIRAAGLVVAITGTNTADAWVATQNPHGGTVVTRGSTVSIFLRTGPQP